MDLFPDSNASKLDNNELLYNSKEPILSAEELVNTFNVSIDQKSNNRSTSSTVLADVESRAKLNNPTGSWLESKRAEARIRNLYNQVSVPKVTQKVQLSEAIWDDVLRKARVVKPCGKHWNTMGHLHQNQLYLYSEEALFLIECNSLELMYGSVAMSLQQAYQLLILDKLSDCTLESYLTYSRLARLGYKVVRHQGDLCRGLQLKNLQNYQGNIKRKKFSQVPINEILSHRDENAEDDVVICGKQSGNDRTFEDRTNKISNIQQSNRKT